MQRRRIDLEGTGLYATRIEAVPDEIAAEHGVIRDDRNEASVRQRRGRTLEAAKILDVGILRELKIRRHRVLGFFREEHARRVEIVDGRILQPERVADAPDRRIIAEVDEDVAALLRGVVQDILEAMRPLEVGEIDRVFVGGCNQR